MSSHIIDGEFQSDKYPTCPPGKVPLSVKDPMAQDLLWEYARRRRSVDAQFADDLQAALLSKGHVPTVGEDPRAAADALWQLLDDIDTLSDSMHPELTPYVIAVQARVARRHEWLTTDGYVLVLKGRT